MEQKTNLIDTEKRERINAAPVVGLPRSIHLIPMDTIAGFEVRPGFYEINGATAIPGGVNFTVHSHNATGIELLLFKRGEDRPYAILPFPNHYRIGNVYSMIVFKLNIEEFEYAFRVDGPYEPSKGMIFDKTKYLLDPYAKAVTGQSKWGVPSVSGQHYKARVVKDDFDWETMGGSLQIPPQDLIIYELHVRGFTKHESSKVKHPGTFSGVTEKIPYLKELGINTLFMMPVYDFNEQMTDETGSLLNKINYWGYTRDAFYFSPKASYGSGNKPVVTEFKEMVCSLHSQGMNFILDMYFEGKSPEFITRCLRYYAQEYHVDGFHVTSDKMDLEWLRQDPVLAYCKIFGDGYQADSQGMYMEMNDGFMINARRFLKSDEGQTEGFYHYFKQQRQDGENLHYITQHNGFTLRDLISYDIKHNEKNGEKNRDGTQYNYSWNCGMEGYTRKKPVLAMRRKQDRNAWVMLLLGMAPPMILAGDEFGNSQKGNNNAYCQDNPTTWLNWNDLEKNTETFDFVRELLAFRKRHPLYHNKEFLRGSDYRSLGAPDVSCHGREPWTADFSYYSRELGILYYGAYFGGESLYFAFNFHWEAHEFYLPDIQKGKIWKVLYDTAEKKGGTLQQGVVKMEPRSIVILEKVPEPKKQMPVKKRTPAGYKNPD